MSNLLAITHARQLSQGVSEKDPGYRIQDTGYRSQDPRFVANPETDNRGCHVSCLSVCFYWGLPRRAKYLQLISA